ncbi:sugar phosphate nucleotidyltransferase [Halorubrum sp. SD690R]|uniref:sugar phosphate nucleotidyltransferase n=1 Tax=Halorubrum sp. SD690R TaxID=2518117 RepID=UPI001F53FF52|nr:sugar phosphate nucleotidyltransferase [Halorubrum sp. SD690R]
MIETDDEGRVTRIVEKPSEPSSTLVTIGWDILSKDVFHACALLRPSAEDEYQLSEAVGRWCGRGTSWRPCGSVSA